MHEISAKEAAELRKEFGIPGERKDAFDGFIAEFENLCEIYEAMPETLGADRRRRIKTHMRQIESILDVVYQDAVTPSPIEPLLTWHSRSLPTTEQDTVDFRALYQEYELPEPADAGLSRADDQLPAEIVIRHGRVLVYGLLFRRMRSLSAVLDFSQDDTPRRRGRPANRPRALLLHLLLERHEEFLDVPVSYADGQPFVRLFERLLQTYGIEAGDPGQLIKRALRRGRRTPRKRLSDMATDGNGLDLIK